jgi:tetratricopeptide (TPR) repeat protein
LNELEKATKKFKEGLDIKAFVRQIFVGDLLYGLARVAAEEGKFERSAQLYQQAISADPGIGAHAPVSSQAVTPAYDRIGPALLARYEQLRHRVEEEIARQQQAKPQDTADADVLNIVHSFVLNDYGNACLNYFYRFGDQIQHRRAIEAFETAVSKNSNLVVAYYNLANALGWDRGDHLQRTADVLARAEKLAPAWSVILVASMQQQIRQIQNTVKEKRSGKQQVERELAQRRQLELEQRLTQETEADDTTLGLSGSGAYLSQQSRAGKRAIENRAAKERSANARARILDLENQLQKLEDEIAELQHKLLHEIFPKLKQIMSRSKLAPLFETIELDFDGGGVAEVLELLRPYQDARYKLDENDVNALRVWAEILANYEGSRTALRAAEKLCNLLRAFYPEHFDAARILYRVYSSLEALERSQGDIDLAALRQARAESQKQLVVIIQHWLANDSMRYVALHWALVFYDSDAYRAALETAVVAWPTNDVYYSLLGEVAYQQEEYAAAIGYYKKAIDIRPLADYWNRLGNTHYVQRDYHQAVDCYQKAIERDRLRAVYFSNLASAFRELGQWSEMAGAYLEARRLEPDNADIANLFGNACYRQGQYVEAIKQYEAAIEINPHMAVYHDNLAGAWEALQEMDKAIDVLQRARKTGVQPGRYEQRIADLQHKKRLIEQFGEHGNEMLPVVTPVALEIAVDLEKMLNLDVDGNDSAFFNQVNEMRQRIEQMVGVRVPGLRVRTNEHDMEPGTYLIFLAEVPLVMGTLSPDWGLFTGPPQMVAEFGVKGRETVNPASRETAVWVGREHWQMFEDAGYTVWSPADYLINHLEAVLLQHLDEFVGHQEIMNMLELAHSSAFEEIKAEDLTLSTLVALVQRLLREQVPITALVEIVELFQQRCQPNTDVLSLLGATRMLPQIRPALPGNSRSFQYYRLGPRLEDVIQGAIRSVEGQAYLFLEPAQTQAIMAGIRSALEQNGRSQALLVTQPKIRLFVRKLAELEFPHVPVLALPVFHAALAQNIVAEIEVTTPAEAEEVAA